MESRGVSKLDGELSNSGLIPLLPPMQRTRDPEGRGAYLRISAESRMTWPSLPQEDDRKWGVSPEHKSGITDLPQMLQEVWYSLWGDSPILAEKMWGETQFYF